MRGLVRPRNALRDYGILNGAEDSWLAAGVHPTGGNADGLADGAANVNPAHPPGGSVPRPEWSVTDLARARWSVQRGPRPTAVDPSRTVLKRPCDCSRCQMALFSLLVTKHYWNCYGLSLLLPSTLSLCAGCSSPSSCPPARPAATAFESLSGPGVPAEPRGGPPQGKSPHLRPDSAPRWRI